MTVLTNQIFPDVKGSFTAPVLVRLASDTALVESCIAPRETTAGARWKRIFRCGSTIALTWRFIKVVPNIKSTAMPVATRN